MKTACFVFNFDTKDEARIVAESLNPEIKHKIPKTSVEVDLSNKTFTLKIVGHMGVELSYQILMKQFMIVQ